MDFDTMIYIFLAASFIYTFGFVTCALLVNSRRADEFETKYYFEKIRGIGKEEYDHEQKTN